MKKSIVIDGWTIDDHPNKEKVINKHRDINVDHDWWDLEIDYRKEELYTKGFYNVDIQFSGFHSQGDGASFTADVDIERFIKFYGVSKRFASLLTVIRNGHYISVSITRNSCHYVHQYTIKCNIDLEYHFNNKDRENRIYKQCDELENYIIGVARSISSDIYSSLQEEYYGLMSDEMVEETLKINEYVFDIYGRII